MIDVPCCPFAITLINGEVTGNVKVLNLYSNMTEEVKLKINQLIGIVN